MRVLNGKGRKQRWTAISEVALAALRTYLEDFRGWSEGHLFQTLDGRPLRNHHMNVMFTRHGAEGWGEPGQPPPLPSHVCYLGDSGQCPRARCPVPAWSLKPDDGPSLLCDLRLRAGGKGARCLQPGDAAVGGGLPSRRDCCHQPLRRFAGSAGRGRTDGESEFLSSLVSVVTLLPPG